MSDQRNSRALQPPRDSHDLSLSPRDITRDSLVTSMLMSLDQFSFSQNSTPHYPDNSNANANANANEDDEDSPRFFDVPRYRSHQQLRNAPPQWKGPGHGHSYSSDLEGAGDDSSRMSSQYSRGRRSNSSTNFPDTYSRFNGARSPTVSRGVHAHGKGSKSSSIGSFDVAHFQGNFQGNGNGNAAASSRRGTARTASLDSGDPHQMRNVQTWPQLEDVPQSPFRSDFMDKFLNDDIDAAPTPTVPSGPRKSPSTPAIPRVPPEPKEAPSSHRNRSTSRSIKSSSGRGKTNPRESVPPLPMATDAAAVEADSAPAPNVGYGKSKTTEGTKAAAATATPQPKEKQSFFKRVFGGGSSKSTPTRNTAVETSRSSNTNATEESSTLSDGSHRPKTGVPPSRDTASSHSNHPTLQKKTSSFFRRRKRSATNDAPPVPSQDDAPPVPPLNLNKEQNQAIPKAEKSPVSSLQEVMNPYLRRSVNAAAQLEHGERQGGALADITNTVDGREERGNAREEFKREFSPDYEPSPNARIRKVHSHADHSDNELTATPSKATPTPTPGKDAKGSSFLDLDCASDNEDDYAAGLKAQVSNTSQKAEPKSTPIPKKKSSFIMSVSTESSPHHSNLGLPLDGAQASRSVSPRPSSRVPELRVQTAVEPTPKPKVVIKTEAKGLDEPDFVVGDPTEDDRSKAQKIYDGNEDFIQKEKAAAWMGEEGPVRQRTLQAYMELYDFANQSVVYSLRQVCGRLVFRAETQQVDRILVAYSKRWCECNPNHGFKATGE